MVYSWPWPWAYLAKIEITSCFFFFYQLILTCPVSLLIWWHEAVSCWPQATPWRGPDQVQRDFEDTKHLLRHRDQGEREWDQRSLDHNLSWQTEQSPATIHSPIQHHYHNILEENLPQVIFRMKWLMWCQLWGKELPVRIWIDQITNFPIAMVFLVARVCYKY